MNVALLVLGMLCCLYLLTGGGQGYSVDGTFSYLLSRSLATAPASALNKQNRDTLKRWGPVVPALGVPFTWLGERLAGVAPWRDSLPLDGGTVRLRDWPPVGMGDGTAADTLRDLSLSFPTTPVQRIRLVSYLSFGAALPQDTHVAALVLRRPGGAGDLDALPVRAGTDTAEWAYDVPGADRPLHGRAPVAGHWPGNPAANLYVATLLLPAPATADGLTIQYLPPVGRLHVRAIVLEGPAGRVEVPGPESWTAPQQSALFSRLGFSFLNAPLMALVGALLVPLARALRYSTRAGALLAAGFGVATMAWPYAKLDFAETAATAFVLLSTTLVLWGCAAGCRSRPLAFLIAAGASAVVAAGAKYTAAWFIPLLAIEVALAGQWPVASGRCRGAVPAPAVVDGRWPLIQNPKSKIQNALSLCLRVIAFLAVPVVALLGVLVLTRGGPTVWVDWRGALSRGWLDFAPWQGLYGLLLSPGKSVFLYAPPLLLALVGAAAFVRRQRGVAFVFVAAPLIYLLVFAGKGVWSGGGWGPRYLVPALPFAACLALPVVERVAWQGGALRLAVLGLVAFGVAAQVLGVAKHPNRYTIMFRDHVLPALPDYGAPLGGPPAIAYWQHFGGPGAGRQLDRPPDDERQDPPDPPRGLGYLFAEQGPLTLEFVPARDTSFSLSLYTCDWDHRGRRQVITLEDAAGRRTYAQSYDFSGCEHLTWGVTARAGVPIRVSVHATGPDTPVLSGAFFDPARGPRQDEPQRDTSTRGGWAGKNGGDGYVLFAWRRGGEDVRRLPDYLSSYAGGDRDWIDTGEADLEDTALLYAPAFSPLLAHAWLLGCDAISLLFPQNVALLQRALGSPPWRYFGLDIHPPHPEYGLGLDFWPLLLRDQFSSHRGFMALVWSVEAGLAAGAAVGALALARRLRCPAEDPRCEPR